jgi:hypothetical protein
MTWAFLKIWQACQKPKHKIPFYLALPSSFQTRMSMQLPVIKTIKIPLQTPENVANFSVFTAFELSHSSPFDIAQQDKNS